MNDDVGVEDKRCEKGDDFVFFPDTELIDQRARCVAELIMVALVRVRVFAPPSQLDGFVVDRAAHQTGVAVGDILSHFIVAVNLGGADTGEIFRSEERLFGIEWVWLGRSRWMHYL